jgi:hypothetical protein
LSIQAVQSVREPQTRELTRAQTGRSYRSLAALTVYTGALVFLLAHFVLHQVLIEALGIASILFGLIAFSIPDSPERKSLQLIFESAAASPEQVLKHLKEMGVKLPVIGVGSRTDDSDLFRAVYLPPRDGLVGAFVPILDRSLSVENMWRASKFCVNADSKIPGVLVYPIGASIGGIAELKWRETSLEDALHHALVESMEICSSVEVSERNATYAVELKEIRVQTNFSNYASVLGSFPASAAASVLATVCDRPFVIVDESPPDKRRVIVRLSKC